MKMNKLLALAVMAISITSLTGCDQKLKRDTFLEIFEDVRDLSDCHYYISDGRYYLSDAYLSDADSYVMDKLKTLDVKKRFTQPGDTETWFIYDIYRHGSGSFLSSQLKFYLNGSIIVNEYGSHILDSYSYFTISKESAAELFKSVQDRFIYADQVYNEDLKATKEEKGVYQLFDSLKDQQSITASVGSTNFVDRNQLLSTLENVDYEYFETVAGYPNFDSIFFYNTTSMDQFEKNPWFFSLCRDYRTVIVTNYIKQDRVCRPDCIYYNVYTIDIEAGRTIYREACRAAGIN